jgi:polyisoprenoid-binding protein YceI
MGLKLQLSSSVMTKKWWTVGVVVVVLVALGLYFGPKIYASFQEDDAPAATVDTSGAQAATTDDLNGTWTVTAGDASNKTAAGYTVDEVLNGSDVTVVGSTPEVSGSVTVADNSLTAGEVVVQTNSITTDSDRRDGQFRGNIFDTATYPTATFTIDQPVDLSSLPKDGTTQTVTAEGTLTLKDRTRPVSVERNSDDVVGLRHRAAVARIRDRRGFGNGRLPDQSESAVARSRGAAGVHPGGPTTYPTRSFHDLDAATSRAMLRYSCVWSVQMLNVSTGLVSP